MEGNFRNVLIIISAVIIGAIFVHGLWTIRKNKNPYKLKASKDSVEPLERDFDRSGFDQDGVGQVRVVSKNEKVADDQPEVIAEKQAPVIEKTAAGLDITKRSLANEPQESVMFEQDVPPSFNADAAPVVTKETAPQAEIKATLDQTAQTTEHPDEQQTSFDAYQEYTDTLAKTPAEALANNPFVVDNNPQTAVANEEKATITANASMSPAASVSQDIPLEQNIAAEQGTSEQTTIAEPIADPLAEQVAEPIAQPVNEASYVADMSFTADEQAVSSANVSKASANSQNTQTIDKPKLEPIFVEPVFPEPEPEPVYQAPVSQPKAEIKPKPVAAKPRKARSEKEALKRNQMEINFGDEQPAKKVDLPSEVIALSVVVPENQIISGAALLPSLLTMGLKFGDMNIFHRHQDNAGNGKITFSLANMLNPGTFDLDAMETFATQGVSLFMTLPNEGDPFEVFSQMLAAAKQLAKEFNGQVLDDKRSVMTKQTEQHYIGKIREFDRKSRIAAL